MAEQQNSKFFESQVLGHPAGLFVLFFTEMWERFSFYGMRVLLINFLTIAAVGYNPGWEWTADNATALFGTYAMLLYLTPILGGIIADKYIGYRWAVVVGAIIMTLGHASMAFETELSLYVGLGLLVIGTGFFKPTMTSIISEMYKDLPEKKDGAYTIFYMGVNAGAFFGMMLCGYIAEKVGWSYGFGLAGVFMLLGTLQFWLSKPLFGKIGEVPDRTAIKAAEAEQNTAELEGEDKRNPFTMVDTVLIVIVTIIGLLYAFNDPISKIGGFDMFPFKVGELAGQYFVVLIGLALFLYLVFSRISRYAKVTRDRMIAFVIFAFFTIFFWMSFEQGASSLVIFARDSVQRVLTGNAATTFNIINALLTIVPLVFISYVLFLLAKRTGKKIPGANIVLIICFAGVWAVAGWMLNRDWNTKSYNVTYPIYELVEQKDGKEVKTVKPLTIDQTAPEGATISSDTVSIGELKDFTVGQEIFLAAKDAKMTSFGYADDIRVKKNKEYAEQNNVSNGLIQAKVLELKDGGEVEITTSWFSILNSFFIIVFASMISKIWESKYNPSAPVKYAVGLIIMAVGFGLLSMGSNVDAGTKVSLWWLVFAYLFHTLGELCLSPVGLSYVSKLVPARMIAFMFGMWYLAIAIGNKLAAVLGGQIENITENYSLSTFFLIFTIVPAVAGVLILLINPLIKKLMHGIK
ncbi:MAG: peptide MFS transporter [Flavobacteriales bacterium]|jgi:POT family proton-dependent oligopeptide transporter|nr:peptide MFS transporter [Flavobacteriales bacterium]